MINDLCIVSTDGDGISVIVPPNMPSYAAEAIAAAVLRACIDCGADLESVLKQLSSTRTRSVERVDPPLVIT